MTIFKLSISSKNRLEGVDPRLIAVIDLALTITLIDFGIPKDGGLRTDARQFEMYCDPDIKTNCDGEMKRSNHQDGRAVDFYAYVGGMASWDKYHLTHIAAAILQAANTLDIKIRWGGFFGSTGWDKPHIELAD